MGEPTNFVKQINDGIKLHTVRSNYELWKKRRYEKDFYSGALEWKGRYEYHYSDLDGKGLVRSTEFLIEEFNEPNL